MHRITLSAFCDEITKTAVLHEMRLLRAARQGVGRAQTQVRKKAIEAGNQLTQEQVRSLSAYADKRKTAASRGQIEMGLGLAGGLLGAGGAYALQRPRAESDRVLRRVGAMSPSELENAKRRRRDATLLAALAGGAVAGKGGFPALAAAGEVAEELGRRRGVGILRGMLPWLT